MGRKKRLFFLAALSKRNEEAIAEAPAPPQEEPVVVEQPVVEEVVIEKPVAKTVKAAKPK